MHSPAHLHRRLGLLSRNNACKGPSLHMRVQLCLRYRHGKRLPRQAQRSTSPYLGIFATDVLQKPQSPEQLLAQAANFFNSPVLMLPARM